MVNRLRLEEKGSEELMLIKIGSRTKSNQHSSSRAPLVSDSASGS
jgi:hypothetical protein